MKKLLLIALLFSIIQTNAQIITTVAGNGYGAGNGQGGYSGDGGQATAAEMQEPMGVAFDAAGNYYISGNLSIIRKVNTAGIISTFAGSYSGGTYSGDGGQASVAELNNPIGLAVDASDNLYITDQGNDLIRKIVLSTGIITTVAGDTTGLSPFLPGVGSYGGDGGQATNAKLNNPTAIAFDVAGNLYIADAGNNLIRKVNTTGIITTVAGDTNGVTSMSCGGPCNTGYSGDGGIATAAKLNNPYAVACDAAGNLYISDQGNNRIRMVNTAGIITTIAGNGTGGFSGDGGQATAAEINQPYGISFDAGGNLYFSDYYTNRIRKINTSGIITTVAGNGAFGYTGDGGQATAATLNNPVAVAFDASGNLYIADAYNNVIREVSYAYAVPIPNICMVTTDSISSYSYNTIHWDNTLYSNVDSFIVYRKDAISSNYLRIGAVSNSLSSFTDNQFSIGGPNGGNPEYSSWIYKLAIRDIYGNLSAKSPYHQTMFIQENSSNFSWNAYTVETGQTNPVTGYSFLRDDNNTGNWNVLVNTSALSTTDPNYASYPNGNWRVDALGFNCPTTQLANLKARSNTTKLVATTGINQLSVKNNQINIYPNPNNGLFVIEPQNTLYNIRCTVYDVNGKAVLTQTLNGKTSIDASNLNEGVYNISVISNEGVANKKLVIVR